MKKPHEQEWEQNHLEARTVETGDGWTVAEAYPASEHGGYANTVSVAKFISAAPDMARALLAWVRAGESGNPSMIPDLDEQARAALRKAGVLP